MVEISMSGSGEGPVWVTGRGYSTIHVLPVLQRGTSEQTLCRWHWLAIITSCILP